MDVDLNQIFGPLLGVGGLGGLLILLGRRFIASVDRQVAEARTAHEEELKRLTSQHERELRDMRERAQAWEATANRREAALTEVLQQNGRLQANSETAVQLLRALRQGQGERELETG
jgi:hypothetical protein